ncbi:MAG: lysophospholipid acyltransferase family protein [Planctomycetota bacterium]|nr:lysophospholipid acyltransferase family protein [Planctomycetota bacterium]
MFFGTLRFRLIRAFLLTLFRLLYRFRFRGIENIPTEGAAILISNHPSYFDPMLLYILAPREIRFLTWDRPFGVPIVGWFLRHCGAIPVNLDTNDGHAFRKSIKALRQGALLGIFPEGGRTPKNENLTIKRGTARLASKLQVPIIPVQILENRRIWPPEHRLPHLWGRIEIRILPPLPSPHTETDIQQQIETLWLPTST